MKRLSLWIIFIALNITAVAQEQWSLERCVDHAWENNLQIKQYEIGIRSSDLNLKQSQNNRLPNLSGSSSYQYNWGRNIDPSTNDFESRSLSYNSYGLNTGMTIYNGGFLKYNIEKNRIALQDQELRKNQTINDIALSVVTAFLNVLFEEDRLKNQQAQLALSKRQLDRTEKLIKAGSLPANDRLDLEAQLAGDEQLLINAENNLEMAMMNLKFLLRLDPLYEMRLLRPEVSVPLDVDPENFTFEMVYARAVETQPNIKADKLGIKMAELDIKIAKSQGYPSIGIGAGLNTTFSSLAQSIDGFRTARIPTPGVFINGEMVSFEVDQKVPTGISKTPFFDQLNENLGFGAGVQLTIPILSRGQNKTNIRQAELNLENTLLNNEQNTETLKTNVQRAVADAKAAKKAFLAAQKTLESLNSAFINAERKFNLGSANTYELTEAKNRMDRASNDAIIAKYDYIFRLKVIDYYLGNPLKLD